MDVLDVFPITCFSHSMLNILSVFEHPRAVTDHLKNHNWINFTSWVEYAHNYHFVKHVLSPSAPEQVGPLDTLHSSKALHTEGWRQRKNNKHLMYFIIKVSNRKLFIIFFCNIYSGSAHLYIYCCCFPNAAVESIRWFSSPGWRMPKEGSGHKYTFR